MGAPALVAPRERAGRPGQPAGRGRGGAQARGDDRHRRACGRDSITACAPPRTWTERSGRLSCSSRAVAAPAQVPPTPYPGRDAIWALVQRNPRWLCGFAADRAPPSHRRGERRQAARADEASFRELAAWCADCTRCWARKKTPSSASSARPTGSACPRCAPQTRRGLRRGRAQPGARVWADPRRTRATRRSSRSSTRACCSLAALIVAARPTCVHRWLGAGRRRRGYARAQGAERGARRCKVRIKKWQPLRGVTPLVFLPCFRHDDDVSSPLRGPCALWSGAVPLPSPARPPRARAARLHGTRAI